MNPGRLLRAEGLAAFAASTAAYLAIGGPWWLYVALALAPDVSMAGYLAGPKVGAAAYNAAHTYLGPVALAGVGVWSDVEVAVLAALVWAAHVGADRLLGYGLKYDTGFADTHLDRT